MSKYIFYLFRNITSHHLVAKAGVSVKREAQKKTGKKKARPFTIYAINIYKKIDKLSQRKKLLNHCSNNTTIDAFVRLSGRLLQ